MKGGKDLILNKRRYKSHRLLSHEALFRRLQLRYRNNEKITGEYVKLRAGFYGEKNMDYKLSLLPHQELLHLPDLRLHNFSNYFQIDSLILTPKVIFILEAKNVRGIVEYFANTKQFNHITDNKTTSYKDPILQAETQKKHLAYWLQEHQINMPIETLVVSTNQSTIIRNMDDDDIFNHRFISLENLLFKMEEIYQSYSQRLMEMEDLQRLYKVLSQKNEPAEVDVVSLYKMKEQHFLQGMLCESCQKGYLVRGRYAWNCTHCQHTSKDCHARAILDHFLLHKDAISNIELRKLLSLESRNTAYRLLDAMELRKTGERKGRRYHAPQLSDFPQDAEPAFLQQSVFDY